MEIEIKGLTKKYKNNVVLNDINLTISKGMFGLLGPNGAGKTTLMKVLSTVESKTAGVVNICGIPIEDKKSIRKIIGYLPQEFSMYGNMTVYQALDYLAVLSGVEDKYRIERVRDTLKKVNLYKDREKKVKSLSGGMKRRLGIAQAIINDPKVIIVDEPTAGLDPEERVNFRNLLCEIASEKIVILSTHIVADIEATCDNLAVLDEGIIRFAGNKSEILKLVSGNAYIIEINTCDLAKYRDKYLITGISTKGNKTEIRIVTDNPCTEYINKYELNIEDAYMELMKRRGTQ